MVLPGGCTCKVDTNLFFFWGGGVLLSSSFMRVPLVCFDSSFFIVISTCVMLVQFVSSVFFLFFSFFVDTSIQHML